MKNMLLRSHRVLFGLCVGGNGVAGGCSIAAGQLSGGANLSLGQSPFGILQPIPTHKHACSCKKIWKEKTISMSISFNIIIA